MALSTWLVLADSSRATVYGTDADLQEGPQLVRELDRPESRKHSRELVTDDRGRRRGGDALGRLRQELDSATRRTVQAEVGKGLTHLAEHEVLDEVRSRIGEA